MNPLIFSTLLFEDIHTCMDGTWERTESILLCGACVCRLCDDDDKSLVRELTAESIPKSMYVCNIYILYMDMGGLFNGFSFRIVFCRRG